MNTDARNMLGEMLGHAFMDKIIMTGLVVATSYPGYSQENGEEEGESEPEGDQEEGEDEEEEPATKGKKRRKQDSSAKSVEPRINWSSKEYECLTEV